MDRNMLCLTPLLQMLGLCRQVLLENETLKCYYLPEHFLDVVFFRCMCSRDVALCLTHAFVFNIYDEYLLLVVILLCIKDATSAY